MPTTTDGAAVTVAMLGNPNTGKSTLFSALAGVRQRVGNYPGVTVERKLGHTHFAGRHLTLIDLPGTYSLAPQSPDEMVAVDVLLGHSPDLPAPDVIVCILDATRLHRNLYLVSQVLELGRPLVVVLNMTDIATERGMTIDVDRLRDRLGVPVIQTQAHRRVGVDAVKQALIDALDQTPPQHPSCFPQAFCDEVLGLEQSWDGRPGTRETRFLLERLLLDTGGYLEKANLAGNNRPLIQKIYEVRERLESAGCSIASVETASRYRWVDHVLDQTLAEPESSSESLTDRIDRVITHRVAGTAIFFTLMILVFQSIFSWAIPLVVGIEHLVSDCAHWVDQVLPQGMLQSLLSDGVIAGVGAVLAFLPQIAILFLFVAVLEECGYMARAAYLMDGLMSRVGLCGKSFIPLLSSFACAVPGIMATRVISNRRDRLVTILVAPLMSCSARLPVYTLMIAAFIPNRRLLGDWLGLQGITLFALYALGIVTAICMGMVLKRTILRGETPPFVMELPDYRVPSLRVIVTRVLEQCWTFVRSAGTLILAVTVVVWAAAYFPHPTDVESEVRSRFQAEVSRLDTEIESLRAQSSREVPRGDRQTASSRLPDLERCRAELDTTISNHVAGAFMEQSILGQLGKWIAPIVRPLGWDWRIGCAVIASLPAREVVIGAMGVIYNLGEGQDQKSTTLQQQLLRENWPGTKRPVFTIPVSLSIMVFFALCAQCAATLFVMRKETGGFRWPLFTFGYMTCLAYLGALITYQVGTWMASIL